MLLQIKAATLFGKKTYQSFLGLRYCSILMDPLPTFSLLPSSASKDETYTRLGNLQILSCANISTPHYIGLTSRGAIPHLSQDMMRDNTSFRGVYAAMEDCGSLGSISPTLCMAMAR